MSSATRRSVRRRWQGRAVFAAKGVKEVVAVGAALAALGGTGMFVVNKVRAHGDPFRQERESIARIAVNEDRDFVESILGEPKSVYRRDRLVVQEWAMKAAVLRTVELGSLDSQDRAMGYTEDTVVAFGVTALDDDLRLQAVFHMGSRPGTGPTERIALCRTRFSEVVSTVSGAAAFTGLASSEYSYVERRFYGKGESDNEMYFVLDQKGCHAGGVKGEAVNAVAQRLGNKHPLVDAYGDERTHEHLRKLLDFPEGDEVRGARINSLWVSNGAVDFEELASALGWV